MVQEVEVNKLGRRPKERPYHPDRVRATLAYLALALFAFTVAIGFVAIMYAEAGSEATGVRWERVKELLQIAIPVESLLIGGAVGFYYGTKA